MNAGWAETHSHHLIIKKTSIFSTSGIADIADLDMGGIRLHSRSASRDNFQMVLGTIGMEFDFGVDVVDTIDDVSRISTQIFFTVIL